jgi:hypothetical protein
MKRFTLLALLLAVGACKTTRKPGPGSDSTTVATDSTSVDTTAEEFPAESAFTAADTVITPHDSALHKQRASLRGAPSSQGRAFGFSQIPPTDWCTGNINLTIGAGNPATLPGVIRKAAYCGIQISWTTPRPMMTTNGEQKGPFSLAKAKSAVDKIAAVVNPMAAQYEPTMFGWSLLDDWLCLDCWGGQAIPTSQIVELVQYAHSKVDPRIPLGLRGEPKFLIGANFGSSLDRLYTVSQWHEKKGPKSLSGVAKEKAWFTEQAGVAHNLGIQRQVYAVNVGDIDGGQGDVMVVTPTQLDNYVSAAVTFDPADAPSCGVLNWQWDAKFATSQYRDDVTGLVTSAKQQTRRKCG